MGLRYQVSEMQVPDRLDKTTFNLSVHPTFFISYFALLSVP